MTTWGWVLFVFNEFFILIVLLNFLIAIIGQSYDEVMNAKEINTYISKCDLNSEIALIQDSIRRHLGQMNSSKTCRTFYLVADTSHVDDENDFQGFVRTIKMAMKRQNKQLKTDIIKCLPNPEILGKFSEKFASISHLDGTVDRKMNDIRKEMGEFKAQVNSKISDVTSNTAVLNQTMTKLLEALETKD